jgi:hypothetical protein
MLYYVPQVPASNLCTFYVEFNVLLGLLQLMEVILYN